MPTPPSPKPQRGKHRSFEISPSAGDLIRQRTDAFNADLNQMAERFMRRRGSDTLDKTDVDAAYEWLTRPPRKDLRRDTVASVMVFVAAAAMAVAINLATGGQPNPVVVWVLIVFAAAFAAFAEVFRRWAYE